LRKSYQPIPVYNNNIWEAPLISRIIATSSTFWEMMQQERPEQLVTFSSHSMPLATLLEVGYPRNVVSDDSRIFWRAYFYYGGKYKTTPLYYPVSMDAVLGKTTFRTMINQYKQQRRWAWGVENVPYVFFNLFFNPRQKNIFAGEIIPRRHDAGRLLVVGDGGFAHFRIGVVAAAFGRPGFRRHVAFL